MKSIFKFLKNPMFLEYLILIVGCFIISLSFNLLLCPNKIASGGVPGLSVVFHKLFGINEAYIQLGINLPLFFIGVLIQGNNFGLKTAVGSFFIPLFVFLTQNFPALSHNLLIASILGGIGVGAGLGFVYISRSSVGGFSLLAQLMHDFTKIKISRWILILNSAVILLAALTFGFAGALYALTSLVITCLSIDLIQLGFNFLQNNKLEKLKNTGCEKNELPESFKDNI